MWLQTNVPAVFDTAAASPSWRIVATQALIGRVAKSRRGPALHHRLVDRLLAVIVADACVLDVDADALQAKLAAAAGQADAQHNVGLGPW